MGTLEKISSETLTTILTVDVNDPRNRWVTANLSAYLAR